VDGPFQLVGCGLGAALFTMRGLPPSALRDIGQAERLGDDVAHLEAARLTQQLGGFRNFPPKPAMIRMVAA
jgi:hypothetical protein